MANEVDSYRFVRGINARLVRSWIKAEPLREIPWTPLRRPLSDCTVALISTGGIALRRDPPFDQEGERRNPWWGDPSFRIIPRGTKADQVRVWHQHIDPSLAEQDLNCLLPLDRLDELVEARKVGGSAPSHYSFMGYLLDPREFLGKTLPQILEHLRSEAVDLVALVPA